MPLEIEAKMKVPDLAAVRRRLQECGAISLGAVLETNTFFDTEDRSLLARDQGLRLRHTRNAQTAAELTTITFKGPRHNGLLKTRQERELVVGNAKDASVLLESLGFARVLSFQKRRESWELAGCRIELDELPHLGTFVEIEGPDEQTILKVREMLHLADRPLIRAGYVALLMAYLQEKGITDSFITFPDKAG